MFIDKIMVSFENLELLKNDIEVLSGKNVSAIIESESDRLEEMDFMIDFEFEEFDIHADIEDTEQNFIHIELS